MRINVLTFLLLSFSVFVNASDTGADEEPISKSCQWSRVTIDVVSVRRMINSMGPAEFAERMAQDGGPDLTVASKSKDVVCSIFHRLLRILESHTSQDIPLEARIRFTFSNNLGEERTLYTNQLGDVFDGEGRAGKGNREMLRGLWADLGADFVWSMPGEYQDD